MKNIVLAINWVDFKDFEKKRNQEIALSLLEENAPQNVLLHSFNLEGETVGLNGRFRVCCILKRDSAKEIGNSRHLPYVKEILDAASAIPCDIFGYINSDILLTKDFFDIFKEDYDAYIFGRHEIKDLVDFNKKQYELIQKPYPEFGQHPGFDAVFFDTKWWMAHRNNFHDDFISGEPYWDMYYFQKIKQTAKFLNQRAIYHMFHKTTWNNGSNGVRNNENLIHRAK
jgi:hypothetical protein